MFPGLLKILETQKPPVNKQVQPTGYKKKQQKKEPKHTIIRHDVIELLKTQTEQ
jgi:hypothetical protein